MIKILCMRKFLKIVPFFRATTRFEKINKRLFVALSKLHTVFNDSEKCAHMDDKYIT